MFHKISLAGYAIVRQNLSEKIETLHLAHTQYCHLPGFLVKLDNYPLYLFYRKKSLLPNNTFSCYTIIIRFGIDISLYIIFFYTIKAVFTVQNPFYPIKLQLTK